MIGHVCKLTFLIYLVNKMSGEANETMKIIQMKR